MVRSYSFQGELAWSAGVDVDATVEGILMSNIPNAVAVGKASNGDDRGGIDYYVYRAGLNPLAIDLKQRRDDPIVSFGEDDLALEIWSVIEEQKRGWTLDEAKHTDFVFWHFVPTGRWVLLPFVMLCNVFKENLIEWEKTYKTATQQTDGRWHSKCVFVPRKVIWQALYKRYGGSPA